LTHVAKAALTLSHGNGIRERGFSVYNAMLGKEKLSLAEITLVALLIVKDTIKLFGSETIVPNTKYLLTAARKAHSETQSISYIWKNSNVREQLNYMKQWSLKRS